MKSLLVYLLVFLVAFVAVTGLIIILNSQYENIFDLNFAPKKTLTSQPQKVLKKVVLNEKDYAELRKYIDENFKTSIIDSLDKKYFVTKVDTVYQVTVKDSSLLKQIDLMLETNKKLTENLKSKTSELDSLKKQNEPVKNESYENWLKTTVSLYESMDVRKAAKLISNYSDNEARDIIYSMKKKKAAEILAQLNPETVQRITRSR